MPATASFLFLFFLAFEQNLPGLSFCFSIVAGKRASAVQTCTTRRAPGKQACSCVLALLEFRVEPLGKVTQRAADPGVFLFIEIGERGAAFGPRRAEA